MLARYLLAYKSFHFFPDQTLWLIHHVSRGSLSTLQIACDSHAGPGGTSRPAWTMRPAVLKSAERKRQNRNGIAVLVVDWHIIGNLFPGTDLLLMGFSTSFSFEGLTILSLIDRSRIQPRFFHYTRWCMIQPYKIGLCWRQRRTGKVIALVLFGVACRSAFSFDEPSTSAGWIGAASMPHGSNLSSPSKPDYAQSCEESSGCNGHAVVQKGNRPAKAKGQNPKDWFGGERC